MNRKNFLKALSTVPLLESARESCISEGKVPFITANCQTQKDAEGPFYKADAPLRTIMRKQGNKPSLTEGRILTGPNCADTGLPRR